VNYRNITGGTYSFLYVIMGLYITAVLTGIDQLWGINFAKFLPLWWVWLTIIIPAFMLIPAVSGYLIRHLDRWSDHLHRNRGRRISFLVLFSVGLFIVWFIFRQEIFFLGDGFLRINLIANGEFWIPVELGDFILHSFVYEYFLKPIGLSPAFSYHYISALSGIVFFVGSFQLARYLNPAQSLLILLAMITSGMTVMFFGYVESYSIVAGFIPYLVLLALKIVDGKISKAGFIITFIIAGLMHSVIFIIFSGVLIIVLTSSHIKTSDQAKRLSKYFALGIILILVLLYLARLIGLTFADRYLMSFFPTEKYGNGIFSLDHMFNIINWILLSGLTALILFISNLFSATATVTANRDCFADKRVLLSVWTTVPPLLFIFLFIPHLAGPRDWDLFSLAVFLLIPGAFIAYMSRGKRVLPPQLIPALFLSLCITISFAAVNNSKKLSATRFTEIIELDKSGNLFNEYAMLFSYADNNNLPREQRLEYGEKAWRQPGFKKDDTLFMANALGRIYINAGEKKSARYYIDYAFGSDSADLGTFLLLADYYRRFGQWDDLITVAERIEDIFSDDIYGLMNAGIIFLENDIIERGGENLRQAFTLDSTNERILLNYGIYQYQIGNSERSINLFSRLSAERPINFPGYYYMAEVYLELGKIDQARQAIEQAEKLVSTSQQTSMVYSLKQKIYNR